MKTYRYAQIDIETGLIVSDSYLSGEVDYPHMIPISDDFDTSNKKYVDGEWVNYTPEPVEPTPEPYQPTNAEVAQMISDLQVDLIIAGVI